VSIPHNRSKCSAHVLQDLKRCFHRYLAIVALLEALVKNSIIYWCPLIIASMVGHEHAQSQGRPLRTVSRVSGC